MSLARTTRGPLGVALAAWTATAAWACGPFFPNRLLMNGDRAVLWAPVADFRVEVERLKPAGTPVFRASVPDDDYCDLTAACARATADADRADLRAALTALRLPPEQRDRLLAQLDELRAALRTHADRLADCHGRETNAEPPRLPDVAVPGGLPAEFALYLRGAVAYYHGDSDAARAAWQSVLALPRDERHFRSTWAAFMLGKSWLQSDPAQAIACFQQVRTLTRAGFADSLGLAAASFGWEANGELKRDHVERAVGLYFEQMTTGDPTAVWSLRIVAARICVAGEDVQLRAAHDEQTRRLVTAYLLAQGGPSGSGSWQPLTAETQRWLASVEAVGVRDVQGADRLAWAAYQAGAFAAAERWLKLAPPSSAVGHWIRAKLLLRGGKVDHAMTELAQATRGFPSRERWESVNTDFADGEQGGQLVPGRRALAELGVLCLSRRQYVEALDALLRGGCWMDAAYVAERVLTVDELLQYVERNWPAVSPALEEAVLPAPSEMEPPAVDDAANAPVANACWSSDVERAALHEQSEAAVHIRHLLARRLTRDELWTLARGYFPRRYQVAFDAYVQGRCRGRDLSLPAMERARALWSAARVARRLGLELIGTELEPDWNAAYVGNFGPPGVQEVRDPQAARRRAGADEAPLADAGDDDEAPLASDGDDMTTASGVDEATSAVDVDGAMAGRRTPAVLTASTADERARVRRSGVTPARRWHYRYVAAELAWEAAALLPDETDETARVLCEAGSWLKARAPAEADRFYKALVRRCGRTELGRQAARLHWFPPIADARP